jgi:glycerophosphoryl diester phosphodiesterase
MNLHAFIEERLQAAFDAFYSAWPRRPAGRDRLRNCRIIAHRGEHDNRAVFENTLAAFDWAMAAGVWGVECDLRWTRDLTAVIHHDPDLRRVFGIRARVGDLTLDELKAACPQVPTLAEVIQRFGRRLHLMIEIKEEAYPDPDRQNRVLGEMLGSLQPQRDFHLITLRPEMFRVVTAAPRSACIPVARWNFAGISRRVRQENYGGMAGHYRLVTRRRIRTHHLHRQRVGTGYIASMNCLHRELNRGVDWIFSNHAAALQQRVNLQTASRSSMPSNAKDA